MEEIGLIKQLDQDHLCTTSMLRVTRAYIKESSSVMLDSTSQYNEGERLKRKTFASLRLQPRGRKSL
jgi:hypothetical protein